MHKIYTQTRGHSKLKCKHTERAGSTRLFLRVTLRQCCYGNKTTSRGIYCRSRWCSINHEIFMCYMYLINSSLHWTEILECQSKNNLDCSYRITFYVHIRIRANVQTKCTVPPTNNFPNIRAFSRIFANFANIRENSRKFEIFFFFFFFFYFFFFPSPFSPLCLILFYSCRSLLIVCKACDCTLIK